MSDYTAEEQAAIGRIRDAANVLAGPHNVGPGNLVIDLGPAIADEIRRAREEEREACAAIVSGGKTRGWCDTFGDLREDLAGQIRARR